MVRTRLQRGDWIEAAQRRLATAGVDAVRVELLARDLGVTKGSFYWHFTDRGELLEALLQAWEATTARIEESVAQAAPAERPQRFLELITAAAVDPDAAALENAVLAWAQKDPTVAERVAALEARRVGNAERVLEELGYPAAEAAAWADIGYTTFVGMISRSTRDPRFRRQPPMDDLARLFAAAQRIVQDHGDDAQSR